MMEASRAPPVTVGHNAHPDLRGWLQRLVATDRLVVARDGVSLTVSGAQGSKLDPSAADGVSAKMGIDATKPLSTEPMEFKRIHVKGIEDVDLDRVLQDDPKAAFARIVAA
jgi:3-polyprenyl-4-hydroxybenzoate decarboxylase